MAHPKAEIADIIIDSTDPDLIAPFWSELLGRPIEGRKGPYVWLRREGSDVGIGFQKVNEAKDSKNRIHLDVSGPDVMSLWKRVEALGGHRVGGYEEGGFLVMADPEGNEFCIVPAGSIELDELGRTNYLWSEEE